MPRVKVTNGSVSIGPRHFNKEHPSLIDGLIQEDMQQVAANWRPSTPPSLAGHSEVRLDFETTGLAWWAKDRPIGVAYYLPATGDRGYLPFGHRGGGNLDEATVKTWLTEEVRGKHIVNSKTSFDVHMAREWGVDLVSQGNTFSDVAFYAALLDDHRNKFSQETLVEEFLVNARASLPPAIQARIDALAVNKIKTAGGFALNPAKFADYPAGLIAERAIHDVVSVDLLHDVMYPLLVKDGLIDVLNLENQVLPVVCEMEKNGSPLDVELLERWVSESARDLEEAMYRIQKASGVSLGTPDKRDKLFELFRTLRVPVPIDPETGTETFAEGFLRDIPHPVIQDLRLAKQLASLRSKFIVKYHNQVDSNGILRYALHQLRTDKGDSETGQGTVSGRFSSAALTDTYGVNIQQVPAIDKQKRSLVSKYLIRQLFVSPTGTWLCADASQIEYRLFAHYANSEKLISEYRDNPMTDYHDLVRRMIKDTAGKDLTRTHTKGVNFAQVYGAGIDKMAAQLSVERFIAEELAADYHAMFPEVKPLLAAAGHVAKPACDDRCYWKREGYTRGGLKDPALHARLPHRGFVKDFLGRRARFGQTDRHYSGLNRIIQGGAATINKRVLVEVYNERKRLEITMRSTVHDELNADVQNRDKVSAISEVLNHQYYEFRVPILWEVGIGANWLEAKS